MWLTFTTRYAHGAIKRSPYGHAKIKIINTDQAKPTGVLGVTPAQD